MAELAQKLGIKPGFTLALLDAPAAAEATIRASLPAGVEPDRALNDNRYDIILFWPTTLDGLAARFESLAHRIVPNGAVWCVIPKKQFAAGRGIALSWAEMQAAGLTTDLVDNKECSITPEEYGTRFVLRKDTRHRYG